MPRNIAESVPSRRWQTQGTGGAAPNTDGVLVTCSHHLSPERSVELKYDGFRALLEIDGAGARLVSRNRNRFKHLDTLAAALAKRLRVKDAILDGEIIYADETGRPIFLEMLRREPACFIMHSPKLAQ